MATPLRSLAKLSPRTNSSLCFCSQFLQSNGLYTRPSTSFHFSLGTGSRSTIRVKASTLQQKDKKVSVEESLSAKTDLKKEGLPGLDPVTRPGFVETNVVKVEQSINIFLTETIIQVLDALYHDRHYARFYVLENVARVPYFAFISVLHLYESFGWWRKADYLKVHFAESWNEMHHLLIMEELGGNSFWLDRILAQTMAFVYYFMTVFMYMLSPRMAYHFSECVEKHAYSTYDKFIKSHGDELKNLPPAETAIKYYMNEDLYLFDEFQTERVPCSRKPKIENLYDVFMNIRDDEAEHCKTMKACQTPGGLRSPHSVYYNSNSGADSDSSSKS
ncbi:Ubiquinol oxidase [Rhynchospora pubera]|uniref:Ubiquinol oxidase n=1 Tax=Rhynchospora pubera TaxID=906938 RepID=A0AAV8EGI9_9POAL|nr:Ubiquinol oxidase [Rhynchospora pubera]